MALGEAYPIEWGKRKYVEEGMRDELAMGKRFSKINSSETRKKEKEKTGGGATKGSMVGAHVHRGEGGLLFIEGTNGIYG